MMSLRSFLTRTFGKPVEPYSFAEADDAYLERLARQATAFSESTITKQPEFHPISHRREDQ